MKTNCFIYARADTHVGRLARRRQLRNDIMACEQAASLLDLRIIEVHASSKSILHEAMFDVVLDCMERLSITMLLVARLTDLTDESGLAGLVGRLRPSGALAFAVNDDTKIPREFMGTVGNLNTLPNQHDVKQAIASALSDLDACRKVGSANHRGRRPSPRDLSAVRRFCVKHNAPGDSSWLEPRLRGNSIAIVEHDPTLAVTDDSPIQPRRGSRVAVLRKDPEDLNWSLYWLDRNDHPLLYDYRSADSPRPLLKQIDEDRHGCFFF